MVPQGAEWRTVVRLGLPNMLGWHTAAILGVKELASGRAAILGFTMPIWTVLLGLLNLVLHGTSSKDDNLDRGG